MTTDSNNTNISGPDGERQETLEQVRNLFQDGASVLSVAPLSEEILKPLRYGQDDLRRLPEQVVGVECGAASHGLCAIVFADKGRVAEFTRDNSDFGSSLMTFWPISS